MTKKDYIKAANIVKETKHEKEAVRTLLANSFVELFRGDNPRFNQDRFLTACDL